MQRPVDVRGRRRVIEAVVAQDAAVRTLAEVRLLWLVHLGLLPVTH